MIQVNKESDCEKQATKHEALSGHRTRRLRRIWKKVDRSISRVLSWTVIHLGFASPQTSSNLPGSSAGHANGSLFGLAPGGVYPATAVASGAVRSYRTFSPLPGGSKAAGRYLFCGTFRNRAVTSAAPRRYLAPCPMEPGLSSSGLHRQRLPDRPGADSSESSE